MSAKPRADIPGRQDGRNSGIGQTLLHRNRWDGEVAKAVEAITGGDPHIAFTILKETLNEIAGETVRPRESIDSSLVHVQYPLVGGSDPHTAIAISEDPERLERPLDARE